MKDYAYNDFAEDFSFNKFYFLAIIIIDFLFNSLIYLKNVTKISVPLISVPKISEIGI